MNIVEGNLLSLLFQIVSFVFGAYIFILLIRFLFQKLRFTWHNPISQFVIKLTEKPLKPFRKIAPGVAGFDLSILSFAFILQVIETIIFFGLHSRGMPPILGVIIISLASLLNKFVNIYFYGIIISAISTWIPAMQKHPIMDAVYIITDPLLSRVRRISPTFASIDISPLIAILGLMLLKAIVISPIIQLGMNLITVTSTP